jgi:hypothetical protein
MSAYIIAKRPEGYRIERVKEFTKIKEETMINGLVYYREISKENVVRLRMLRNTEYYQELLESIYEGKAPTENYKVCRWLGKWLRTEIVIK